MRRTLNPDHRKLNVLVISLRVHCCYILSPDRNAPSCQVLVGGSLKLPYLALGSVSETIHVSSQHETMLHCCVQECFGVFFWFCSLSVCGFRACKKMFSSGFVQM